MDNTRKAYNRRTIRLPNYDYTQSGLYFVTICTYKKKWMFGEIVNKDLDRTCEYIVNNPARWAEDSLNIKEGSLV